MEIKPILDYAKRGLKMYPDFVFGTGSEAFSDALRAAVKKRNATNTSYLKSVWKGTKDGFKASEAHNAEMIKTHGSYWKSTKHSLSTLGSDMKSGWQAAPKLGGKFKGAFKAIGKRMPLIGSVLMIACELPNIFRATKENGIVTGTAETVKAAARVGGGMAGAAIGQALIPIPLVGGLIGWCAGEWLAGKIVGKSYSEKQAEKEQEIYSQAQAEAQAGQAGQITGNITGAENGEVSSPELKPTVDPITLQKMQQMLYANNNMNDDFMFNASGLNKLNAVG